MSNSNIVLIFIAFLCCMLIAAGALANGTPGIDWWVVGSGGGLTNAGNVTLNATLGQPIIGTSSGGSISLEAGFWPGAGELTCNLYLPQVSR
jgi:hypothetical protein